MTPPAPYRGFRESMREGQEVLPTVRRINVSEPPGIEIDLCTTKGSNATDPVC